MGSHFKFNERAIEQLVNERVNEVAQQYEQALAQLSVDLKGRSVEDIKPLLRARWHDLGGDLTDPELTDIATTISEGVKINFNVQIQD